MGSAAVANHALSCPTYGALNFLHHGADSSPNTSNSTRTRFRLWRTSPRALPKRSPTSSRRQRISTSAVAGHALLGLSTGPSIDVEGIVAEAPTLLALSSDLDWQQSVSELREEALGGLQLSARGEREMALERLGAFIDAWLHDSVLARVLQPSLLRDRDAVPDPHEELGVRIRAADLRLQATLQATEELANGVDRSFDWESEAAELRQCLANQERVDFEQKLWTSWESARQEMDEESERLHHEALAIHHTDDSAYLTLLLDDNNSREEPMEVQDQSSSDKTLEISGTWWTLAVLLATARLFGSWCVDRATAADVDALVTSAVAASAKDAAAVPEWVAPTVLATPVVSYVLFTLYRNKVNPYAKLTDWVFGLVAMAILGNLVLIATVGVRLY